MARATIPKVTWGASFANTLNFGQPLDNAVAYSTPREGSEWVQGASGARDAWLMGHNQRLRGTVRNVPTSNTTDPLATGWDGSTGWAAFLEWARDSNAFRFFPDKDSGSFHTSYLIEPLQSAPGLEQGTQDRTFDVEIEEVDGNRYTGY